MTKLKILGVKLSPPVRAVLLTCHALNLDYEFREVDLFKGEHKTDEYLKLNPQHTIPVLIDGEKVLSDSHAICGYLVDTYGKRDTEYLYPKDVYQRSLVDQRLFFEAGVLFVAMRALTIPLFFKNRNDINDERLEAIATGYNFAEKFLENNLYMAGNKLTIADFSVASTLPGLEAFLPLDAAKYPKVTEWLKRLATLPYFEEVNNVGSNALIEAIKDQILKMQN